MKVLLSVSLFALSLNVFSQSGGLGGAPAPGMIDPTTNPSGTGFGGPTGTITDPGVNVPSTPSTPGSIGTTPGTSSDFMGPARGNEFPRQEMQEVPATPSTPSTNFPSTTPSFPDTTPAIPITAPDATNPAGTGVVPGPTGSQGVGP